MYDLAEAVCILTCSKTADAKSWLDGPYSPEQVDEKLGSHGRIPLKRFGDGFV